MNLTSTRPTRPQAALIVCAALALVSGCGGDKTPLIGTDDFGDLGSSAKPLIGGIAGLPPCRSLSEYNFHLNFWARDRFAGTMVSLSGHGGVFAVLFDKDAPEMNEPTVVRVARKKISACTAEVKDDPTRHVQALDNLPSTAAGLHAAENSTVMDFAYTVTKDRRLLVVGDQYSSSIEAPMEIGKLLKLALKRAPQVPETSK